MWERDITVGCSDVDEGVGTIFLYGSASYAGSTSYDIRGLEEVSTYSITVTAINSAGNSEVSNAVTAITMEAGKWYI